MFWENTSKGSTRIDFFKLMQADEMIILPKQSQASPMTKIVCWDDYQFVPVCCNQSLSYKWKGTMRREPHAKETKKKKDKQLMCQKGSSHQLFWESPRHTCRMFWIQHRLISTENIMTLALDETGDVGALIRSHLQQLLLSWWHQLTHQLHCSIC